PVGLPTRVNSTLLASGKLLTKLAPTSLSIWLTLPDWLQPTYTHRLFHMHTWPPQRLTKRWPDRAAASSSQTILKAKRRTTRQYSRSNKVARVCKFSTG